MDATRVVTRLVLAVRAKLTRKYLKHSTIHVVSVIRTSVAVMWALLENVDMSV